MTASNMTVEDRLAEKLKSAEFAQWFGEDDLRELVAKALDKAFISPRRVQDGYTTKERPALLIEVATEHVKERVDALVLKAVADELAKDPARLDRLIKEALKDGIEALVLRAIGRGVASALSMGEMNVQSRISDMLRGGAFRQ